MKLAAIYNVWDGVELLRGSMLTMKDHVDIFIIVYQDVSNYGEKYDPLPEMLGTFNGVDTKIYFLKYEPNIALGGGMNETAKRNAGLDIAREEGCTHFLHVDCDEYYESFGVAKKMYLASTKEGSVCKLMTYFKHPTYRFEHPDNYYVPFIHRLRAETLSGKGKYPFYVDPTRRINTDNVVELPVFMHHFSYIRTDIQRKIRNSSAKNNILKSNLLEDWYKIGLKEAENGYFVKDFGQKLMVVPNIFNIKVSNN